MSNIRVRFAPSPTGYLHVGGVRTLLLNWLYAKKMGGTLILRIEDTDLERSTQENTDMLLRDIQQLGFDYAEGVMPDGSDRGPHAPYSQSKRLSIYIEKVSELLKSGRAYYAFDTEEQIVEKREAAIKFGRLPEYDGAKLSLAEAEARIRAGEKAVVRFRAPAASVFIRDELRGEIEFKAGTVDDFVLTRSPREGEEHLGTIGMPTYNFCCVVDDHEMRISHAIRGEDHLSNTVKQQLLYEAFGWTPPTFVHIAMVLGADKQKLSKRNGDASVHDYIVKGYLNEALMNFLALLGWWPKGDYKTKSGHPEVIQLDELISLFSLEGLQKAPAVFDVQKLKWMNGFYIRMLPVEEIARRARPFFDASGVKLEGRAAEQFVPMIDAIRTEVQLLSELPEAAARYFSAQVELQPEARALLETDEAKRVVKQFYTEFAKAESDDVTADEIGRVEKTVAQACGVKGKGLFMPFRASVTGMVHGPELKKVIPLLGRKRLIERMQGIGSQVGL